MIDPLACLGCGACVAACPEEGAADHEAFDPEADRAPARHGELCFFSVPANPIDFSLNATYHEKLLQDLLGRLGYDARPQHEGHAAVLAELAEDDFTGIGISCGGGMHNVCVAYKALNVISFSTTRGGDWIDRHVAQVLGISQARATRIKESGVDLANPRNREEQAVEI
jgi:ferredoxin